MSLARHDARPADPALDCASEPIHAPGSIQPHGHLLAFGADGLRLTHASAAAAEVLGGTVAAALGRPAAEVLAVTPAAPLVQALAQLPASGSLQLGRVRAPSGRSFQGIGHCTPGGQLVLEFEAEAEDAAAGTLEAFYPVVRQAFAALGQAATTRDLAETAAAAVRGITGFDRVLIYRFEENWDGTVIAEAGNGQLPSYAGLGFPAADIPAQARRLYEVNPQRLIVDAGYRPVPVLAAVPGAALDLTFAGLRSVSPVHREYMRNMGTPASMSVSVLRGDGRLWGLISCHHACPRIVGYAARNACDLIAQMFAVRVAAREGLAEAEERGRLKALEGRLLGRMAAAPRFADGLAAAPQDLLGLAGASGAAVLTDGACVLLGETPGEPAVRRIAEWLTERQVRDCHATACLPDELPEAAAFAGRASGLLAISISGLHPSFVMWFRPEVIRTVTWGGAPGKLAGPEPGRLSPRHSFAAWAETVRNRAEPWSPAQLAAARDLRAAVVGIVLRAAEERAELTSRLERVNSELAAFSYSVSHDLRAPFRHIVGFAELLREREGPRLGPQALRYIATIVEAAETAGRLVDALLNFSRMGRAALTPLVFDPATLVEEVWQALAPDREGREVEWQLGPMPPARGDPTMLRQVFHNLRSNAIKYSRGRAPARIGVTCRAEPGQLVFSVTDNGDGFDMAYAHKLFGVFQRLHRADQFEGIGIGLANVKRIVERHGGRAWAEGAVGQGATFHFSLPDAGAAATEDA